jgi:hypothetical protein
MRTTLLLLSLVALAVPNAQAARLGVKIATQVARAEEFDWGQARWDLQT